MPVMRGKTQRTIQVNFGEKNLAGQRRAGNFAGKLDRMVLNTPKPFSQNKNKKLLR